MAAPPSLSKLPADFHVAWERGVAFAVRASWAAVLAASGYGPAGDGELRASALSGRKPLLELSTSAGTLLVRRFAHGGLLRFATGARFLDGNRPFREIELARHLARAGVATPEIVAARARRLPILGFELDLVTRRVDGAIDLGHLLASVRRGEIEARQARAVWGAFGALVRRMHDVGFLHADLTPNNVLVDRGALAGRAVTLVVLDLDRARLVERPTEAERRANLGRLLRFVARREERDGRVLSRSDYARFLRAYEPERGRWQADWRALLRAHARARWRHHLGWVLEGRFAPARRAR